jgi:type VI secretion system protein ImpM
MSGGVGFYGKLPGAGDFVRRRLPSDFVDDWDRHFQRAVETGRRELGEQWATAWRDGPAWRFVLPAQLCGNGAWCGLTGPAVDRIGRAFPMVLAAPCTGDVAQILGNDAWFDALERVYRNAQENAVSVETFDAQVAVLPRPLADASDLAALWRGLPWDSGQWQLDMPGGAATGVMLTEAWRQLCMRPGAWCLWWTEGATRLLATRGLPRSHALLLEPPRSPPLSQRYDVTGFADGFSEQSAGALRPATMLSHDTTKTIRSDWLPEDALAATLINSRIDAMVPASDLAAKASSEPAWPLDGFMASHVDTLNSTSTYATQASLDPVWPLDGFMDSRTDATDFARDYAASPLDSSRPAHEVPQTGDAMVWLDDGRTLVLSADDGPHDTRRVAAQGIREAVAASAPNQGSLRANLMSLHEQLRGASHGALGPASENGAAIVVRFDGPYARLLRVGASALWLWRRGQLLAPFVERAAGAGGEFDDLLFGDAWLDMPGIGTGGEPDYDEATILLEAGDRLLLLVTRELMQLPHDYLVEALALPTCDDARAHLAIRAGLTTRPAQWPLAVVGVHA